MVDEENHALERARSPRFAPQGPSKGRERMSPGLELEKRRQRRGDSTRAQMGEQGALGEGGYKLRAR